MVHATHPSDVTANVVYHTMLQSHCEMIYKMRLPNETVKNIEELQPTAQTHRPQSCHVHHPPDDGDGDIVHRGTESNARLTRPLLPPPSITYRSPRRRRRRRSRDRSLAARRRRSPSISPPRRRRRSPSVSPPPRPTPSSSPSMGPYRRRARSSSGDNRRSPPTQPEIPAHDDAAAAARCADTVACGRQVAYVWVPIQS